MPTPMVGGCYGVSAGCYGVSTGCYGCYGRAATGCYGRVLRLGHVGPVSRRMLVARIHASPRDVATAATVELLRRMLRRLLRRLCYGYGVFTARCYVPVLRRLLRRCYGSCYEAVATVARGCYGHYFQLHCLHSTGDRLRWFHNPICNTAPSYSTTYSARFRPDPSAPECLRLRRTVLPQSTLTVTDVPADARCLRPTAKAGNHDGATDRALLTVPYKSVWFGVRPDLPLRSTRGR